MSLTRSISKISLICVPIEQSASGPVLYPRQAILPLFASTAVSQPRTPNSPPLFPTSTLSCTTNGAMVIVSPLLISPTFVFQRSFPLLASTAQTLSSSVLKKIFPLSKKQPRFTTSQQATPCAPDAGSGSNFHFAAPFFLRSSA